MYEGPQTPILERPAPHFSFWKKNPKNKLSFVAFSPIFPAFKANMETEENLSDASLIEEDEEEDELIIQSNDEISDNEIEMEFHGFTEEDAFPQQPKKVPLDLGMFESYDFDLTWPFPPNMQNCSGWYDGKMPKYKIKYVEKAPSPIKEDERKVQPLKIKRAQITGSITTPSPLLQRESREWKPSSQFFKPLNSGTYNAVVLNFNNSKYYYLFWLKYVLYSRFCAATLLSESK